MRSTSLLAATELLATGLLATQPAHATPAAGARRTRTTIKFASSASLTGSRRGTRTTIGLTVGYYNPKAQAFVRWPNKQVTIQYTPPPREAPGPR